MLTKQLRDFFLTGRDFTEKEAITTFKMFIDVSDINEFINMIGLQLDKESKMYLINQSNFEFFIFLLLHKAYKSIPNINKELVWSPESHFSQDVPTEGTIGFKENDIYEYQNDKFVKILSIHYGKSINLISERSVYPAKYTAGIDENA